MNVFQNIGKSLGDAAKIAEHHAKGAEHDKAKLTQVFEVASEISNALSVLFGARGAAVAARPAPRPAPSVGRIPPSPGGARNAWILHRGGDAIRGLGHHSSREVRGIGARALRLMREGLAEGRERDRIYRLLEESFYTLPGVGVVAPMPWVEGATAGNNLVGWSNPEMMAQATGADPYTADTMNQQMGVPPSPPGPGVLDQAKAMAEDVWDALPWGWIAAGGAALWVGKKVLSKRG